MLRRGPETCVFCGRPIEPGEDRTGRGESAAHPGCADAALADDALWDRIAAAGGDTTAPEPEAAGRSARPRAAGRLGCGLLLVALAIAGWHAGALFARPRGARRPGAPAAADRTGRVRSRPR